MTPAFVRSDWCKFETDIMVHMSLNEKRESVIPVLLEPCKIPETVGILTYIDVKQSPRWRERLVDAIRRTDTPTLTLGVQEEQGMERMVQTARTEKQLYIQCVQEYTRDKRRIQLEGKSLEADVNNTFALISQQLLDQLDKQRKKKIEEIHELTASQQDTLLQKRNTADDIVRLMDTDFKKNSQNLKHFIGMLEQYASLTAEQGSGSYRGFGEPESLVEQMNELVSSAGHLRLTDVTKVRSQEDRVSFLKDMYPSWAILPQAPEINIRSFIRCPYFVYDGKTVCEDCCLLSDGGLSNQSPSQPHHPSDMRLKTYSGAVGTRTMTAGGLYYWENKLEVDLEKEMDGRQSVFEVALSTDGVFDGSQEGSASSNVISIRAYRCVTHKGVCLSAARFTSLVYHGFLTQNQRGKWPSIELGFLLDTFRQRLTVYDVTKKGEITSVDRIGDVEEFTPQFAVFAPKNGSVKLSVITGIGLKLSDKTTVMLEKYIEKRNH
ncbi:uncharacterized protein [Haliotis asinina]